MAEALNAKKSAKFDLGSFEDGYEVAVKELLDTQVNQTPVPKDEAPRPTAGKVINLMDALRKVSERNRQHTEEASRQRKSSSPERHWSSETRGEKYFEAKVRITTLLE